MSPIRTVAAALACTLIAPLHQFGQEPVEVGSQSPNSFIYGRFLGAYLRNGFNTLVSLPPSTHVQKLGTTGLIQLFPDVLGTPGVRHALVKADANAGLTYGPGGEVNGGDVYQITAPLFAFAASANNGSALALGNMNTTGFPRGDTQSGTCGTSICYFQFFEKNYALFSVLASADGSAGGEFLVKGGFFTQWRTGGDISGFGPPVTNEATLNSPITGTAADWQQYQSAYLFRFSTGTANERYVAVTSPVAQYYQEYGGPAGNLGFPVEIVRSLPDGKFRQSFEGGTVEYRPGERPVLLLPVQVVTIEGVSTSTTVRMRRGETLSVRVRLVDAFTNELTDRTVNWITSNGRIVAVDASGAKATLRAVGAGVATVTAISEGKRSAPVTISVASQCCEAGEGAPTSTISQAFQEAIRRNRLNVRIPTAEPVQRRGAGYYQEFQDAATGAPYLIAAPDPGSTAYLVKGEILGRLNSLGGLTGVLGYPSMEETAGGRQNFSGRYALAGRPVRVVQSPLLERWALAGYETGTLGPPTGDASQGLTFTGALSIQQSFASGLLAASGEDLKAFAVAQPLLGVYLSLNGPRGNLGLPLSDEVIIDGVRRQSFEGGTLIQPSGGEVTVSAEPRQPRVLTTPSIVTAGSRVRIAVGGFPDGASIEVTAGSDPAFAAVAANGAFAWEVPVPGSATAATVKVVAAGPDGQRAEGSYRIRSLVEAEPRLSKVLGDLQTGPPGALLPLPLRIQLRDREGSPIAGAPVVFQAAPGVALERADRLTDSSGEASAWMRLPESQGVALATATAARLVVTFRAQGANTVLPSFPGLSQDVNQPLGNSTASIREHGALLASAANILRFYQDNGALPAPNGLADPLALNLFLRDFCLPECDGFLTPPGSPYPVANLARVPAFATPGAVFEFGEAKFETIRDWLAQGDPVLIGLQMTAGGDPAGMHYIVARGIAENGGVLSFDPSPFFGRTSLNDFLVNFNAGGRVWRGSLVSVARLSRRPPGPNLFYLHSNAAFTLAAEQGACSAAQVWLDQPATAAGRSPKQWWYALCDAPASRYQVNVSGTGEFSLSGGSAGLHAGAAVLRGQNSAAVRIQSDPQWSMTLQRVEVDPNTPPLNSANFQPQLAPGSLMSIFGSGLLSPDGFVSLTVSGIPLPPVAPTAFRVSAWLPPSISPGRHLAVVQNSIGRAEFEVEVLQAAPAVFQLESGQPVVTDPNGNLITSREPAARGGEVLVFATGLGELSGPQAVRPVSAEIDGKAAVVSAVEWVEGQPGVYRVRVIVPAAQAPGPAVSLVLKQGGAASLPVALAVR